MIGIPAQFGASASQAAINNLHDLAEVYDGALGDIVGASCPVLGKNQNGFSQKGGRYLDDGSFEVKIVRLDQELWISNRTYLIKIDFEHL